MRLGSHLTEEQRVRDSAAHMGQCAWNKGLSMTDEQKKHNSVAHIGLPTWNKGIPMTIEQRQHISKGHMGQVPWNKGIPMTDEAKAKTSLSHMGCLNRHWKGGPKISQGNRKAKRRILGFIALNSWFSGCDGHHLDNEYVLYVPTGLHRSARHNIWKGRNMVKINTLAAQWWLSQVMRTGHTLLVGAQI